ncbi:hypothetical protein C1645_828521 [Glomus cerebriforme]|uniref:Uncharacterized protein n=1 Tax=Glomus cerebriforme TaxID=658196 RepID=A0A397SSC2_9GLOM|nr:hypothetical protein C1645_828521 [Glomus cerebriforme]
MNLSIEEKRSANFKITRVENGILLQQFPNIIYEHILAKGGTDTLEKNNIQFTVEKTLLLDSLTEDLNTPIKEICQKLSHLLHSCPDQTNTSDSIKQFINANKKQSVLEIYSEIKEQRLPGYELLTKGQKWYGHIYGRIGYSWPHFILWACCSSPGILIYKTTMFIESHWRILKRDYLYKFARPRLDLLCYVIVCKVRRNEIYPLLLQSSVTIWQELGYEHNTNESFIDDPDPDTSLQTGYNRNIEDENCEIMINKFKTLLNETHHYLDKSTNLPQRDKWLENIVPNFNALKQMVHQIKEYEHQKTMPRSWRDKTRNTFYWQ